MTDIGKNGNRSYYLVPVFLRCLQPIIKLFLQISFKPLYWWNGLFKFFYIYRNAEDSKRYFFFCTQLYPQKHFLPVQEI